MKETILISKGKRIIEIPRSVWEEGLKAVPEFVKARLAFMGDDHHRIRNYVVRELPRIGAPLTPERIAADLDLPLDRVTAILEELERHMTFLFRNQEGAVAWAYPVTVDPTPHRVTFSTGEALNAA
jgi:hypothetical protein